MRKLYADAAYLCAAGFSVALSAQLADWVATRTSAELRKSNSKSVRPQSRVERQLTVQASPYLVKLALREPVVAMTPPEMRAAVLATALDAAETAHVGAHGLETAALIGAQAGLSARGREVAAALLAEKQKTKRNRFAAAGARSLPKAIGKKKPALARAKLSPPLAVRLAKANSKSAAKKAASSKAVERAVFPVKTVRTITSRQLKLAETPGVLMYMKFVGQRS